uniref:Sulfurtransferase DsrH n=1 Tax=mine drainage metagenome TaxID=410659 RepID=E6QST1_9ZZZZ
MLHIVNKSPFENTTLASCLRVAGKGGDNALLLIEDGVYAITKNSDAGKAVHAVMGGIKVYALMPDVEARGMQDRVLEGVTMVDYAGFVDLVIEHNNVQSWL